MSNPYVYPLATSAALDLLGGKGRSLGFLSDAGFPVPTGFHLATTAYWRFVEENDLQRRLIELARPEMREGRLSFDQAGHSIAEIMRCAKIPDDIQASIVAAWGDLDQQSVAVRSSATAEDLPGLSFAGQQDTYLNVHGEQALLDAVRNCWVSLWNPRAMSYRHQMGIAHTQIAMAVVIQELVAADVSGILFTANPATGDRQQMIVNASYGLGEAVVGGEVTPDTFTIDRETLSITSTTIGGKERKIVSSGRDGTRIEDVDSTHRSEPSLTPDTLTPLLEMALEVERQFGGQPQDIEWLIADNKLWLLQSRPITNLPPPPLTNVRWEPPEPSAYLGRSQLVEHIPDPASPLFESLHMNISLQHYWGLNLVDGGAHDFVDTQLPVSFAVQTTINGFAYRQLGSPPRTGRPPPAETRWGRLAARLPTALTERWNKIRGDISRRWAAWKMWCLWIPQWRFLSLPAYLRDVQRWGRLTPEAATIEQLWSGIRALSLADARYWYRRGVWNAFALTRGSESALHDFLTRHTGGKFSSGQFLSGLKSPAFDAHVSLWKIATEIRGDRRLLDLAVETTPFKLIEAMRSHPDGGAVVDDIDQYCTSFGHQIFSLDFAEPCEAEDPDSISRSLHALILQEDYDPVRNQQELTRKRRQATREAIAGLGQKHWEFRKLLWRARHYYPNREAAMFQMGRAWTVLRPLAFELGKRLVNVDTLKAPDDIFYLNVDELSRAVRSLHVGDGLPEYQPIAVERRQLREARRYLSPPAYVGKVPFWLKKPTDEKPEPSADQLTGSAVSPGQITAPVSLILTPADFDRMRPGTILVCPTTTPAWTQLFPQAVGLVTDIGGMLAHGSIVAREYGIPAVLGVGDATRRIRDGQTITVDGTGGVVSLLEETRPPAP